MAKKAEGKRSSKPSSKPSGGKGGGGSGGKGGKGGGKGGSGGGGSGPADALKGKPINFGKAYKGHEGLRLWEDDAHVVSELSIDEIKAVCAPLYEVDTRDRVAKEDDGRDSS